MILPRQQLVTRRPNPIQPHLVEVPLRRIANGAMRPGMLDDSVLQPLMILPRQQLVFVDATCSPERLTTHMANTGEDVETLSMLLESACYRERADVRSSFVLHRRVRHVRATCGRGHKLITVEAVTALRSLG